MEKTSHRSEIALTSMHNICLAAVICTIFFGFVYISSASDKGDASFSGIYSSHGVDDDADGQTDHVDVDVGINVYTTGTYQVLGSLFDDGGNETIPVPKESYLSSGSKQVTLQFYGLRQPGVYHLRNLTLYDSKGQVLDHSDEAYTTEEYLRPDPDPQLALLTGKYADRGIDSNGDGKYEFLTVDAGIKVFFPGQYTLTGYLYDKKGSEIGWAIDNGVFKPGDRTMHLAFDGMSIERHGIDGPYTLGKLFLTGINLRVKDAEDRAYNTSKYNCSDFAVYNQLNKEKLISGIGYGELLLTATIRSTVPVSSGVYSYDLEGINIPPIASAFKVSFPQIRRNPLGRNVSGYAYDTEGVYMPAMPNNFTVSANGVKTLNVGLKKLPVKNGINTTRIWVTTQVDADKNGAATVSSDLLSPGNYNAKIFGDVAENVSQVYLTMTVVKKLVVNGQYNLHINTTGFPEGDYSFKVKALNGTFKMDDISLES